MKKEISKKSIDLIFGLAIIVLGIIILVGSINMYTWVIVLLTYAFLLYGIARLIGFILNKKVVRDTKTFISIVLNIILAILLIIFYKVSLSIIPIVFSLYFLFNSICRFVEYSILLSLNLKSRFKEFIMGLIYLVFAFVFILYPFKNLNLIIIIMAIYCMILGLGLVLNYVFDLLAKKTKFTRKLNYKMTLPLFIDAFVPIIGINRLEKQENDDVKGDMSIYIHLSKHGANQFGHVDLEIDNKIYSYGSYDKSRQKLFTAIGDGVLTETMTKYEYINFCIFNSRKTVVEYVLKLTDKQKAEVRKKLKEIMKDTVEWEPPSKKDPKNVYKDYSSKLHKATKTNFYKFKKGKYKTYFVIGVNCTYLPNEILKNSVFEVLKLVGIVTPGTYYTYLEENYRLGKMNIISKKIYDKENIHKYLKGKKVWKKE